MTTEEERDLGFGAVVARESLQRLLNRDGTFNVRRRGLGLASLSAYHALLEMSWPRFLGWLSASYVVINAIFAVAYLLCGPGALQSPPSGAPGGAFLQAFFFSVETFATIGYGNVYPVGVAANAIMTVEALCGLLGVALATGIIFARFSRPTARIRFSRHALISPYRGITALEFRIVNERRNELIELEAKVLLTRFVDVDGERTRKFHELALERRRVTFFPLSWTVVHPIDETSPLHGVSRDELVATDAEILILLTGMDDTFSQIVHARTSYRATEIVWGGRFRSVFNTPEPDGAVSIDVRRLDELDRLPRREAGRGARGAEERVG